MFGDLDWPLNALRGFVSISWASCYIGCWFYLGIYMVNKDEYNVKKHWINTFIALLCPRRHRAEALSDDVHVTSDVCRQKLHRGTPRHTWLGHHFQCQKVKGQLAGGGGILWRPRAQLVPERYEVSKEQKFNIYTNGKNLVFARWKLWAAGVSTVN